MKLGEALSLRAKQAQRLNDLRGRISNAALVQEGDTPPEDATGLLAEYTALSEEHAALMDRIANTNNRTRIGGVTLAAALQQREHLIRMRNINGIVATKASPGRDAYRYSRSEVKYVPTINITAFRLNEKAFDDQVRELDAQIQKTNWETDLLD